MRKKEFIGTTRLREQLQAGGAAQVVIMCVPQIGQFFKVRPQNWQEWLFALAVGFGSILVAILTKVFSR